MQMTRGNLKPLGYQALAVSSAAVSLTIPAQSRIVYLYVETNDIRWRDDGTAPTATVGSPLKADTDLIYDSDLTKVRFIAQGADATVHCHYYA